MIIRLGLIIATMSMVSGLNSMDTSAKLTDIAISARLNLFETMHLIKASTEKKLIAPPDPQPTKHPLSNTTNIPQKDVYTQKNLPENSVSNSNIELIPLDNQNKNILLTFKES